MTESESVALPLGDAPLISTDDIIADNLEFVKGFLKKSLKNFKLFQARQNSTKCGGMRGRSAG